MHRSHKTVWTVVSAAMSASLALLAFAANSPNSQPARLLAARALGPTQLIENLRDLCDTVGGRPPGSKALEQAVEWGVDKFRAAGLENVSTETYTVPTTWLPGKDEAECISPARFPLRLAAAPFSSPTPGGHAVELRVVNAGDGTAEAFARLGDSARGAAALIMSNEMKTVEDLFGEYLRNRPLLEAAHRAGVAALLLQSTRPRGLLYRHPMTLDGSIAALPTAVVAREHAARLARLAEGSEVRIRLKLASQASGPHQSRNVVAEIRGREKPEEIVLLGAHLDSWDLGTGEEDNGVNACMAIDVARGFTELGLVPRRTLRFVLFTDEEAGMWGSRQYVQQHAAELDHHVAMITFDSGSGRTSGFYLNGRDELRTPVNEALVAVEGLGASSHTLEALDGTDNFDFLLAGVPNLVANQDWNPYLPEYHAASDVFERVNEREAKVNAALASVLTWGLAERPERPAARQTRAEVEQLLKDTKLDEQMKAFGQWDDWVAGRRGTSR